MAWYTPFARLLGWAVAHPNEVAAVVTVAKGGTLAAPPVVAQPVQPAPAPVAPPILIDPQPNAPSAVVLTREDYADMVREIYKQELGRYKVDPEEMEEAIKLLKAGREDELRKNLKARA